MLSIIHFIVVSVCCWVVLVLEFPSGSEAYSLEDLLECFHHLRVLWFWDTDKCMLSGVKG